MQCNAVAPPVIDLQHPDTFINIRVGSGIGIVTGIDIVIDDCQPIVLPCLCLFLCLRTSHSSHDSFQILCQQITLREIISHSPSRHFIILILSLLYRIAL